MWQFVGIELVDIYLVMKYGSLEQQFPAFDVASKEIIIWILKLVINKFGRVDWKQYEIW